MGNKIDDKEKRPAQKKKQARLVEIDKAANNEYNDEYRCWIVGLNERKPRKPNVVFSALVAAHGTLHESAARKYVRSHYYADSFAMQSAGTYEVRVRVENAKGKPIEELLKVRIYRPTAIEVVVIGDSQEEVRDVDYREVSDNA